MNMFSNFSLEKKNHKGKKLKIYKKDLFPKLLTFHIKRKGKRKENLINHI